MGEQQRIAAQPGTGERSLGACMAPAYNNNIKSFNGLHYFAALDKALDNSLFCTKNE